MKQLTIDFQGWSINVLTLRELLNQIATWNVGNIFRFTNEFLDSYPVTLEDDGMAYGVNPMYLTEVGHEVYQDNKLGEKTFNLFRESLNDKK